MGPRNPHGRLSGEGGPGTMNNAPFTGARVGWRHVYVCSTGMALGRTGPSPRPKPDPTKTMPGCFLRPLRGGGGSGQNQPPTHPRGSIGDRSESKRTKCLLKVPHSVLDAIHEVSCILSYCRCWLFKHFLLHSTAVKGRDEAHM